MGISICETGDSGGLLGQLLIQPLIYSTSHPHLSKGSLTHSLIHTTINHINYSHHEYSTKHDSTAEQTYSDQRTKKCTHDPTTSPSKVFIWLLVLPTSPIPPRLSPLSSLLPAFLYVFHALIYHGGQGCRASCQELY